MTARRNACRRNSPRDLPAPSLATEDRQVSVLILPKLSKVFSISVEQLLGMTTPAPLLKRRLSPRAMRHAERVQFLSKTLQRFVVRIIDLLEDSRSRDRGERARSLHCPAVDAQMRTDGEVSLTEKAAGRYQAFVHYNWNARRKNLARRLAGRSRYPQKNSTDTRALWS
jgi:hypothetical protein